MWVRSEYTSELAVLSAWLSVLVPWNVAYHSDAPVDSTIFFLRFALFEVQLRFPSTIEVNGQKHSAAPVLDLTYPGVEVVGNLFVTTPLNAVLFYDETLQTASMLSTIAAVAFALALVLSFALYFRTAETIERLPYSEVRVMGSLLAIAALGTATASLLYLLENDVVGTPIPVGVLVIGALAAILLQTEEIEGDEDSAVSADEATD